MPAEPGSSPQQSGREAGFALVEMLVAMAILGLVGLTLARFQTFQLGGTTSVTLAAAARIEADNRIIDALILPQAPATLIEGENNQLGRHLHWTIGPAPLPGPALPPGLVAIEVRVQAAAGGPTLARRTVLRPAMHASVRAQSRPEGQPA